MEWCRLYASLPNLPCVQAAEHQCPGAFGLLVESMCYLTSAESQGFIPHTQVPRFAGPDLDRRVKALVCEEIWIEEDRGYLLNPDLWNEERNLSDAAERKRRADRERMAAKRASERAGRDAQVSRDSRATSRATGDATPSATSSGDTSEQEPPGFSTAPPDLQVVDNQAQMSRDSRAHRRQDKKITPPTPPQTWRQSPLMAAVQTGEGGESSESQSSTDSADIEALIEEVKAIRAEMHGTSDWTTTGIRLALTSPEVTERGWALARPAMLDVAARRDSKQPGRLAHGGDWWHAAATQSAAKPGRESWPPWCGECTSTEHRWVGEPDHPGHCPRCHPLNDQKAAVS